MYNVSVNSIILFYIQCKNLIIYFHVERFAFFIITWIQVKRLTKIIKNKHPQSVKEGCYLSQL